MLHRPWPSVLLLITAVSARSVTAQSVSDMAVQFVGMTAVTGFEQTMADSLLQVLVGGERDRAGNVVAVLGSGTPTRLVACPMDEWGYVVGNVLDGGYVTLRRVGRGAPPLFDQGHEGHRATIWGSRGPVAAVVGVPSTHLRRGRRDVFDRPFSLDDAVLDLGAESEAQVHSLGVDVLDPVASEKAPHLYGESLLAGPEAGQRGSCAALTRAYLDRPNVQGTVTIAFTVESRLGHRGLSTVMNARGPFDATLLLDYPLPERLSFGDLGTLEHWALDTSYDGLPIETIDLADVEALTARIDQWMEGER